MRVSELIVGRQVTQNELDFARETELKILAKNKACIIQVVGSRVTHETRISLAAYHDYCQDLEAEQYQLWLNFLNEKAKTMNLSAGNILQLVNILPYDCPAEIRKLLQKRSGKYAPDADLDLALDLIIPNLSPSYIDKPWPTGSGLAIDVFQPGDYDYLLQSEYNF